MNKPAAEVARDLADALEAEQIQYAIGGALGGESFDRSYVSAALDELVGPDDSRIARWAALLRDVDGP